MKTHWFSFGDELSFWDDRRTISARRLNTVRRTDRFELTVAMWHESIDEAPKESPPAVR